MNIPSGKSPPNAVLERLRLSMLPSGGLSAKPPPSIVGAVLPRFLGIDDGGVRRGATNGGKPEI